MFKKYITLIIIIMLLFVPSGAGAENNDVDASDSEETAEISEETPEVLQKVEEAADFMNKASSLFSKSVNALKNAWKGLKKRFSQISESRPMDFIRGLLMALADVFEWMANSVRNTIVPFLGGSLD